LHGQQRREIAMDIKETQRLEGKTSLSEKRKKL